MKELYQLLLELHAHYPKARISDYVKLIYQNEFGCEHLAQDEETALARLCSECETAHPGRHLFEKIGNGYQRVYLKNALALGASPETLTRMFLATSRLRRGSKARLLTKLTMFHRLCAEGKLPFNPTLCQIYLVNYNAAGLPPVHHSTRYQLAYSPAYRVIGGEYVRFFELFLRLDRLLKTDRSVILVAIDGPCTAGKTTLARLLSTCYDCNVFHTDDFYLRPEQKTEARLREPGGNMDRERLMEEVLEPLQRGEAVLYRPYSCKTQTIAGGTTVPFRRLNIIEGSYCLHPDLRSCYNLKAALQISPEHQIDRLKRRERLKSLGLFRGYWIPLEKEYAEKTGLFDCADLVYSC